MFEQLFWGLRCFFVVEMMNWKSLVLFIGVFAGSVGLLSGQYDANTVAQRSASMPMVIGKVVDSASAKAINMVVVDLVKLGDKPMAEGGVSDTTGNFKLVLKSGYGKYLIRLTAVGYPVLEISDTLTLSAENPRFNCGLIYMSRTEEFAEKMEGAEIRVSGPVIENKIDRLVYNAGQDITSKGGSASDLLAKVPMVEVDMDGNVSIRGSRNLRVLINGRPSGMMAGSVADALRSLPADGIDKIEVITNPSAKYDAEGTAGIINIILKQVKLKGKTGNISSGLGTRSANLSGDVSIQNGTTNFTIRLGGHFWRSWGGGWTNRNNTINGVGYALRQENDIRNWGGGPRLTLSSDFQIDKTSALSVSTTFSTRMRNSDNDVNTSTGFANQPLDFLWRQATDNFTYTLGLDANIDYRKTFKKPGRELGVSAQFSGSQDNTDYSFLRYNQAGSETRKEVSLNIGKNNELTAQIDFTEPLHQKLIWELGLKTTLRSVNSDYHFDSFNYVSDRYSPITDRNNQFDYYQNVYGGYAQFTYNASAVYSLKLGGRYEATEFGGVLYLPVKESYQGLSYQNFIPYVNVNRKLGKGGYLRGTYTQRIQRPSLFYLNPYTNFSDPLNITTGNPRLSAEVSNNFEVSTGSYGATGGWGVNVFHRRIGNAIETIRSVGQDRVYRTTYGNIGLNYTTGFDVNSNLKGKWKGKDWSVNFNGGLGWVDIRSGQDTGLLKGARNQGITYSAGIRSSLKLNKYWQMELWGRFNAPTFTLQGTATNWFFHMIGVKRRFHSDKGGFGFGLDNPFIPRTDFITKASGQDFDFYSLQRINMWGVRVNFDYKFGAMTIEKPKPVLRKLQNDDLKPAGGQEGM